MTDLAAHRPERVAGSATAPPRRRTLVLLASAVVAFVAVLFAMSGSELPRDASAAEISAAYDYSETLHSWGAFAGMAVCALVLFLGSAVRRAVRGGSGTWLGEVSLLGFGALALTFATWIVLGEAQWNTVQLGDETMIRTLNAINDVSFLPLMTSMICLYVGTGLAGLVAGTLPRWLGFAAVAVGVTVPFGPLGFIGFVLLPVFLVTVAVTVRLEPSA